MRIILDQSLAPKREQLSDEHMHEVERLVNELVPRIPSGMIDVRIVDEAQITRLNRMYRSKDAVTDVLSFSYIENDFDPVFNSADTLLGDVAICLEQARRQAEPTESGTPDIELELTDLLVHGILHVLGYDHERPEDAKRMFPLQDRIVQAVL